MAAPADSPQKKKMLPWLKRLLDDDDSSDSSSQLSEPSPKKKEEEERVKHLKKRRRQQGDDDASSSQEGAAAPGTPRKRGEEKRRRGSSGVKRPGKSHHVSSDGSDSEGAAERRRRRRLKKSGKAGNSMRHKRSHAHSTDRSRLAKDERPRSSKKSETPADETKSKAAAFREQRMRKLHALRVTSGEHGRRAAFKLKRQQSLEALKLKERNRMRLLRAARETRKISAGAEADVKDESEPRSRSYRPSTAKIETMSKTGAKRKMRKPAALKKEEKVESHTVAVDEAPRSARPDDETERDETQVEFTVATKKGTPVDAVKQEDKEEVCVASPAVSSNSSPDPVKMEDDGEVSAKITEDVSADPAKLGKAFDDASSDAEKTTSDKREQGPTAEDAKIKAAEFDMVEVEPEMTASSTYDRLLKSELNDKEPRATTDDAVRKEDNEEKQKGPEDKQTVKSEPTDKEPLLVTELVKNERREEKQVETQVTTMQVKINDGGDKKITEETKQGLLLDMMPIPRKVSTKGEPSLASSATSFMIPKRTFTKTVIVGPKEGSQRADAGEHWASAGGVRSSRRALDPPVHVAMPPLPSPESSPKFGKLELIRQQRKRSKKHVPVKSSLLSAQDRALMRLSRKRNSIFMAAAELAAQVHDIRIHKKSATRMMGYEVYDADGQTLLDLVPRLSCATKSEMGSSRESYPASFFGVSCSTPKAKREAKGLDDSGDNELSARKVSCYEELRFERPEDRQFYQQKMYGTAFVPQKLRGWITLIVRNARFERKSTGIRFNQDRDRDEFAASLSKRYTINKSVPRCDIPRENWQKLMRNQPGIVYLHYYNREDAERASQTFRDDLGHQLELKLDYKAGVVIRRSPSPGPGPRSQRNPRRSYSSERGAPEPSPVSAQNDSAHSTPSWRRERHPALKNDFRHSSYDRGAPPPSAPWSSGEARYGPSVSGSKGSYALLERTSCSRSRSKSFHSQQNDSAAHERRAGLNMRERTDCGSESISGVVHSDADTPARKRARTLPRSPRRSPSGQTKGTKDEKIGRAQGGQEGGEIKSSTEVAPVSPVGAANGAGIRGRVGRARSPLRRWKQEPNNTQERRGSLSEFPRDRSRGPATKNLSYQQHPSGEAGMRRSRSRSRPGASPVRSGRGGSNGDRYTKERRGSQEFGRPAAYDNSARERRPQSDRGRGRFNGHRGGGNSRS